MVNEHSRYSVILASASPRRRELIEQLGLKPVVKSADIDETPHIGEDTRDYVLRLSLGKARKVADQMASSDIVIGADTVIDYNGQILGKPQSLQQSVDMLSKLSAHTHQVLTGVTVIAGDRRESLAGGKAGSYAIQGKGARFVESISGSYSNVVGLPLFETAAVLASFGIDFD